MTRSAGALIAVAFVMTAAQARADDTAFTETHYDVGVQMVQGLGFAGQTASGAGLHLTEHDGFLSRALWLTIGGWGGGYPAEIPEVPEVGLYKTVKRWGTIEEYVENEAGGVMYVRTVEGWVYDEVLLTPEEKAELEKRRAEEVELRKERVKRRDEQVLQIQAFSAKRRASYQALNAHGELLYLPNRDDGHLRGVRGAWFPLVFGVGRQLEVAAGYAGARWKVDVEDPATGMTRTFRHRSHAAALRFGFAPARWAVLHAEVDVNVLGVFRDDDEVTDHGSAVRATAALLIPKFERIYGKAGVERIGLGGGGRWSTFFELGARF